jgi:hypothetical protein
VLNIAPQHFDVVIYQPRNPQASSYFRCVQDHFEQLEMHWQDRYAPRYGFWRPYVTDVIYRYLECGDLHFGFARTIHNGVMIAFAPALFAATGAMGLLLQILGNLLLNNGLLQRLKLLLMVLAVATIFDNLQQPFHNMIAAVVLP